MRQRRRGHRVLLDRTDDSGHRPDSLERVLAHRRLTGQHHRVGAVEHGVGNVGGLGAGRAGVVDHRLQHLGGHDHRLGVLAGHLDGPLLHQRHLLQRQLHPQVAAGHHDRVEREHDRLEVVDGLRLLQLGDDRHPPTDPVHDLVDELDISRRAHERQCDQIHPEAQREFEVLDVLLRQRRRRDTHAGQGHALVVADLAALGHGADHVVAVDVLDDQAHVAVVDEDPVPGLGVLGEALVGRRHPVVVAFEVLHGDAHRLAVGPVGGTVGEPAQPDLGALQVGEDAHGAAGDVRGRPDPLVIGFVIGVVAVAEVEPGDVHSGLDELSDGFVRGGGGAKRTDDLSASSHGR